jgi:UDP-N-acetylmuramoyl-tripeptide--D-alanyl-D-alanine ligase
MIHDLYKKFVSSTGISTDTRNIKKGNLFFALQGPNFNANNFAEKALEMGASFSIIDDPTYELNANTILVDDVLETLQQLANHHRKKFNIPVLAITGSNGKTTTKELINAVLSTKYKTHATYGNLNNRIGVPLTLLGIKQFTEIAIIEMGANSLGEISMLCEIAEPDYGIITNIGKAHTEGFGGFDGVIRGKSELYQWLLEHKGKVFINSEDKILKNMAKRFSEPFFYPNPDDYYHCKLVEAEPWVVLFDESEETIHTQLIGTYNFINAATALCIGKYFEVIPEEARKAIAGYKPQNNRSQIIVSGSNTIILDAYNANPDSVKAALNNLINMKGKRKVAILGDMFELGEISDSEHSQIGKLTKSANIDEVYFCGRNMAIAAKENKKAVHFNMTKDLDNFLKSHNFKDSLILIKGSRGMQLESIVDNIRQ